MRGFDQTSGHRRIRVGLGLMFAAWATLAAVRAAAESPPPVKQVEALSLAADRVRYWDSGAERWVILEGRAAGLQGVDGLRSDTMVARIAKIKGQGKPTFTVDLYAEGRARSTEPASRSLTSRRLTLERIPEIRIDSHEPDGLLQLQAPPTSTAILARAFPTSLSKRAAAKPPPAKAATSKVDAVSSIVDRPGVATANASTQPAPVDSAVRRTQGVEGGFQDPPILTPPEDAQDPFPRDLPPPVLAPPVDDKPRNPTDAVPLPPGDIPGSPLEPATPAPLLPGTRRIWTISPSNGGGTFAIESLESHETEDGAMTFLVRGGVNIVADTPGRGTVDITADNVVIWTRRDPQGGAGAINPAAGVDQPANQPLEVYLEGNVVIRQDKRKVAGTGDQSAFRAERAYYDFRTERLVALDAEVQFYAPGLIAPIRTHGAVINQYREQIRLPDGSIGLGLPRIRADKTTSTGSRFPNPGYRFDARSVDLTQITEALQDPITGKPLANPRDPGALQEDVWRIDARQNLYFMGPVPVFYWPHIITESDDLDPPLRNIGFRAGNVFGQSLLADLSGFKLIGVRRPPWIDNWNVDVDYLSYRGLAVGSEIGWFGKDFLGDLRDPYRLDKSRGTVDHPYFGYFDIWGLHDQARDILGPGPAVVTNGPPGAGKAGYQRTSDPPFQDFRGRFLFRHMQSLMPSNAPEDEDLRVQFEAAYNSDRNFLEEYYKRLFDTGLDQSTLVYGIWQKENRALTLMSQANLQSWYTDTQWMPKLEYYRLGDSLLNNWVSYSQNSGIDYANTHTAVEVNNPNIFAFLPLDPVSNTSGPLRTGRAWTSHEIDVPLNFDILRVVPYAQGQLIGWDNQIGSETIGRAWGGFGAKANVLAWRTYTGPTFENELLNIHGLAHKVSFDVDYRSAFSNVPLDHLAIQDTLDDNTYEYVRRYFALTNYVGGLLPAQYDPRHLTLRRTISPIAGTVDVQDTIQTLRMGIHQRLQTKRGPDGKRRIIDYMVFDLDTTYFPNARRDNFGKPFGQNTYNWEWFIGDRTSILSYGWFEFFDITGQPILSSNPRHTNDPFGLSVITSGISISRPPRGMVFIGYSIINTGPIATSAINLVYNYWLSPKWYTSFATVYDFGNAILLGSTISFTKIGADYLTSIGLTVDPQRNNYTFGFEIAPRFSPNMRFGSAVGSRFDSRFAPTQ